MLDMESCVFPIMRRSCTHGGSADGAPVPDGAPRPATASERIPRAFITRIQHHTSIAAPDGAVEGLHMDSKIIAIIAVAIIAIAAVGAAVALSGSGSSDSKDYVYYDANGGKSEQGSEIKTTQLTCFGTNIFTRDGYSCIGWSTDKKATTASYQEGDAVKLGMRLYAVWKDESGPKLHVTSTNQYASVYNLSLNDTNIDKAWEYDLKGNDKIYITAASSSAGVKKRYESNCFVAERNTRKSTPPRRASSAPERAGAFVPPSPRATSIATGTSAYVTSSPGVSRKNVGMSSGSQPASTVRTGRRHRKVFKSLIAFRWFMVRFRYSGTCRLRPSRALRCGSPQN